MAASAVIAGTNFTSSLIRQTGKFTLVIGQQNSLFSAGALAAARLLPSKHRLHVCSGRGVTPLLVDIHTGWWTHGTRAG